MSFRPAQSTAWPRTYGPQTAKVVGPGESIWTDKYGRVKVKFHWDRLAGTTPAPAGCVCRALGGQGYGGGADPRVGDEVVVDFINGDPDRPIITGRVYNDASMPPWALPAAATQMGFMSRTKDGSVDNANALRFEDKAGAEQVWLSRAQSRYQRQNDESHATERIEPNLWERMKPYGWQNQKAGVKGDVVCLTGTAAAIKLLITLLFQRAIR